MTDDKNFKRLVRSEARRTGRKYTAVRAGLRPPAPVEPLAPAEIHRHFEAIVDAIETWRYGRPEVARLVTTALMVPGNVLLQGMPGNGMTALGQGVAAAIDGNLVSVDGRTGLDEADIASWRDDDVVVIAHFDGLDRAEQVAVLEASRVPAIVLAKVHPIAGRMPYPPDDETRERFLFSLELGPADVDTQLRIINETRDRTGGGRHEPVITRDELERMRATVGAVAVPSDVRRSIVELAAATTGDRSVLIGASTIATIALVDATAAVAASAGRDRARRQDLDAVVGPVLRHRIVFRDGVDEDLAAVLGRASVPSA